MQSSLRWDHSLPHWKQLSYYLISCLKYGRDASMLRHIPCCYVGSEATVMLCLNPTIECVGVHDTSHRM